MAFKLTLPEMVEQLQQALKDDPGGPQILVLETEPLRYQIVTPSLVQLHDERRFLGRNRSLTLQPLVIHLPTKHTLTISLGWHAIETFRSFNVNAILAAIRTGLTKLNSHLGEWAAWLSLNPRHKAVLDLRGEIERGGFTYHPDFSPFGGHMSSQKLTHTVDGAETSLTLGWDAATGLTVTKIETTIKGGLTVKDYLTQQPTRK